MKVNEIFSAVCEASGKSQGEIAEAIGTRQQYLQKFLSGKGGLREEILIKLAGMFSMNADYVTGKSENPFAPGALLKLFIRENFLFHNLEPLYTILRCCTHADLIFLIEPADSGRSIFKKVLEYNPLQKPVAALAVRAFSSDHEPTYFLLRRRDPKRTIIYAGDYRQALNRIVEIPEEKGQQSPTLSFGQKVIDKNSWLKIQEWEKIKLKDCADIFKNQNLSSFKRTTEKQERLLGFLEKEGIDSISYEEVLLLKAVRNDEWDPYDVIKLLKSRK